MLYTLIQQAEADLSRHPMECVPAFLTIWAVIQGVSCDCHLAGTTGFAVIGDTMQCNGEAARPWNPIEVIIGDGSGPSNITNAQVTILFRDVSSTSSLAISGSIVTLLFDGASEFNGIFCGGQSNVTVAAIGSGSLVTDGGSSPGLGAPTSSSCGSLVIVNGSVVSVGGDGSAGLGTGRGNSRIDSLAILDGNVIGNSRTRDNYGGSGIGTGYGGNAIIRILTIMNGNITGTSSTSGMYGYGGSGIGTGLALSSGNSHIESLAILGGTVTGSSNATGLYGYGASGIGTGVGYGTGNSRIGILVIENGNVHGSSSTPGSYGCSGAGIGTGAAWDGGKSNVESLAIENANVTAICSADGVFGHGASGIGTGSAWRADSGLGSLTLQNANIFGRSTCAEVGASGIGTGSGYGGGTSRMGNLTIAKAIIAGSSSGEHYLGSGIGTGSVYGGAIRA